ncbi:MAG TPA: GNAT family N-acetyltransferase [Sphingomicrobium sp.]|nr:GNAT family N-acetyltransferase [Sphingomicrobium sp.]
MSKRADTLLIRVAQPEEREALEELQRRASLANENDRPHLEAHPDVIHLPPAQIANGQVFVAELDGQVAGFAAVVGGEVDGLFVEPALWRRGVGAALIEEATHQARLRGLALTVTANPHALEFYEKCGFSLEGEAKTRFGPGLRMSR